MEKILQNGLSLFTRKYSFLGKAILLFGLLFLYSVKLKAQVVVNNKSTISSITGSSMVVSHTTGTESFRLMVVGVSSRDKSVTSVTYDGTPLTLAISQTSSNNAKTFIYYLLAPSTGTGNVEVYFNGSVTKGAVVSVMSLSGVNQSNPVRNFSTRVNNSSNPSLSLNTVGGDLIYNIISVQNSFITNTGVGQTLQWNQNSESECRGSGSTKLATSSNSVVTYSISSAEDWSMSGISIRPAQITDLSLVKSVNNSNPLLGSNVVFTILAKNNGPDAASLINVNNFFGNGYSFISAAPSAGTSYNSTTGNWNIGSLNNGAEATLNITVQVLCAEDYLASSEITGKETDPELGNNIFNLNVIPQSSFSSTYEICFGGKVNLNNFIPCNKPAGQNVTWHTDSIATSANKVTTPTAVGGGVFFVAFEDTINNCYSPTKAFTVIENPDININKSVNNILCYAGKGAISIDPTGGTAPFYYLWNDGVTTQNRSNLPAGTYSVTLTDSKGCSKNSTTTLSNPPVLNVLNLKSDVSCFGSGDGSITLTASGGTPVYNFDWHDLPGTNNTKNRTFLSGGVYQVIVNDLNGCSKSMQISLNEPAPLSAISNITQPTCSTGGIISIITSGGNAPYTYTWTDISSNNTYYRSNLNFGNYQVTITDANGCSIVKNIILNEPACGAGKIVCISNTSDAYSVDPDPNAISYQWTVPTGASIISGQGTAAIIIDWTNAILGSGKICVHSVNDCGESNDFCQIVNIQEALITIISDPVCTGQNLNLYGNGGVEYSWTGPDGFTSTLSNPVIYQATAANSGLYQVTATNVNGCVAIQTATVLVNFSPVISEFIIKSSCGFATGSIDATVNGGTLPYSYSWSNGETTEDIANLESGIYKLIVTDSLGCVSNEYGLVGDLSAPDIILSPTSLSCPGANDGSIISSANGGASPYTYFWSTGETTQNISSLAKGVYTLKVTDASGCSGVASYLINEPNPIILEAKTVSINCFGGNNGQINLIVNGGTPGFTFNWTTTNGTGLINGNQNQVNLTAGIYKVTVTDSNLCSATLNVEIYQPAIQLTTNYVTSPVKCYGEGNGLINLNVVGGTAPYTYVWSNSATTQDLDRLNAGIYTVSVTDSKACTATNSITVNQPANLSINYSIQNLTCYQSNDGKIDVTISGGTAPFTYVWSNGATSKDINNLSAGTYILLVKDANNCFITANIEIFQPAVLSATYTKSNLSCYGLNDGAINLSISGGTGIYSYNWSDGLLNQPTQTSLIAGTYHVLVEDQNNCSLALNINISQPDSILVSAFIQDVKCNGGNDGLINLIINGGTGPYIYNWSNGLYGTKDQINLPVGNYTVSIEDQNSCQTLKSFSINEPDSLKISGFVQDITCYGVNDGQIITAVNGGTTPYYFVWSNNSSDSVLTNLNPDTYSLQLSDNNLCISNAVFTISEPNPLELSAIVTPNCPGQPNGKIELMVSGGNLPYATVNWSDSGIGTLSHEGLNSGTYSVDITDSKGCLITETFELKELNVSISGENKSCLIADGATYSTANDGVSPYTYSWSNGQNTKNIYGLLSGTYTVIITDAAGCSVSDSIILTDPICNPPVAQDDYYKTRINVNVLGTLAPLDSLDPGYDYDPDNLLSELEFLPLDFINPNQGIIVWDSTFNGGFTFKPALNYEGLVTLKYQVCDPLGLCATAFLRILVEGEADLELIKTADKSIPNIGDEVTFTILIVNSGPNSATNVEFKDALPSGYGAIGNISAGGVYLNDTIKWSIGNLPSGSDSVVSFTAKVNAPTGALNQYKNTAEVTKSDQFDPDSSPNNEDGDQSEDDEDFVILLPQIADLDLIKTVDKSTPNAGEEVTFSIRIHNSGPDVATNVGIKDILPPGYNTITAINGLGVYDNDSIIWNISNLASGADSFFTFKAVVNSPTGLSNEYKNTVQVTKSDQFDPDSTPNNDDGDQSEDDEDWIDLSGQEIDLELIKSVNNPNPNLGDTVTFNLLIRNKGISNASNVVVKDYLPNGYEAIQNISNSGFLTNDTLRWNISTLNSQDSLYVSFDAKLKNQITGLNLTNKAEIYAADQKDKDSTPGNFQGAVTEDDESVLCLIPNIIGKNNYCTDDSLILTASGGISYLWNTPRGLFNGNQLSYLSVTSSDQGTYSVDITTTDACIIRKTITVNIINSPEAILTAIPSGCLGSEVKNDGQILISGYSFSDQFQISEASSFDTTLASVPLSIPVNNILRNNIQNPSGSFASFAVRLLNNNGCKTDYTLSLNKIICICLPLQCIPFLIIKTSN